MALFIELDSYTIQQERTIKEGCLTADKVEGILLSLKKSLCLGGTQTIRLDKAQTSNAAELIFTAKVDNSSELLYRFWVDQALNIKSCITLFQKSNYLRARSSQINKNITKTITFINALKKKSHIFLLANPLTTQYELVHGYYLGCCQPRDKLSANLKILITESLSFAKSFGSFVLYKSNLVSKYQLMSSPSQLLQSYLFAPQGGSSHLSSICQYLSVSNFKISYSMKEVQNSRYERNEGELYATLNRVVDIYNNRTYPRDSLLYADSSFFSKGRSFRQGAHDFNDLITSYKPEKAKHYDNNVIFSTILLTDVDKENAEERCIAASPKVQIISFPARFKYGYTAITNDIDRQSFLSSQLAGLSSIESSLSPAESKPIEKVLVVKSPNSELAPQMKKKIYETLRYERTILRNTLRGAECMYLPKYYQTDQKNSRYRELLIMDYVPGITLGDFVSKANSGTLSRKFHILLHLANAIRFLQTYDIAHLDLSVNNVILTFEGILKIIDFGEAYHQKTLEGWLKQKKEGTKKHSPGRTFPFAPPQTSQRRWNFTSKQDIYSFGVIAFRLLMGYLPNLCPDHKLIDHYLNRTYNECVYLSPEGLEWVGEHEVMLACMQLVVNCMHVSEEMRPNPSWTHILFKKMFELVEAIS